MDTATEIVEETLDDVFALTERSPRPLGAVLVAAGMAHLLVPGLLLWTAGLGYRYVLGVEFDPQSNAKRRVRLLGVGMLAVGGHLLYHGDAVLPE